MGLPRLVGLMLLSWLLRTTARALLKWRDERDRKELRDDLPW